MGRRLPDRGGAGRGRGPRRRAGAFHHIAFGVEGSDARFVIATTRPELLAACVGVTAHPSDARYRHLFGKRAVTPLFHVPVPIFPSELADPEKGTGILMVCTFGDATDVVWWREQKLALRQIIGRDGRLVPVTFGAPGWESADAEAANAAYAAIAGKTVKQARKAVVELLRETARARGRAASRSSTRQVLREGRPAARVRHDAPVVRPPARQEGRAPREGRRDPLAPRLHAAPLPQLDGEPEQSTGASAASATSACRSRSGTRSTRRAAATTSARSSRRRRCCPSTR